MSPQGSDSNIGSRKAPFRTLNRAQMAVRLVGAANASVLLLDGIHRLSAPLLLDQRDSGAPGQPMRYEAVPGADAVIAGDVPLTDWGRIDWPGVTSGAVYAADVSSFRGTPSWPIRQLRVDGNFWPNARWPIKPLGAAYNESWLFLTDWSRRVEDAATLKRVESAFPALLGISPNDLPPGNASEALDGAYVDLFGTFERDVGNQLLPVLQLDQSNASMPAMLVRCYGFQPRTRFILQNVRQGLAPDHWWLDEKAAMMYLWIGSNSSNISNLVVTIPVTNRLVHASGAEWISFTNLTFVGTGGSWSGYWHRQPAEGDTAIMITDGAAQVKVQWCTFQQLGGHAVWIAGAAHDVLISNSLFSWLGQGGILIHGSDVPAPGDRPYAVSITRCVLHHLGLFRKNVAGVAIKGGSFIGIMDSRFDNLPHQAIGIGASLRRPQFLSSNVQIQGNVISNTNLETDDTGAIVVYIEQISGLRLNQTYVDMSVMIRYNNISNSLDASSKDGKFVCVHGHSPDPASCRNHSWSIYLDGAASGVTMFGNILDASLQGAVYLHQGGNNNMTNNVLVNGDTYQVLFGSQIDNYGHTVERNIFAFNSARGIILGTLDGNAAWEPVIVENMDRNLFWCSDPHIDIVNGSVTQHLFPVGGGGLKQWQSTTGHDMHSQVQDPAFVAPTQGDFNLQENSPAWKLGFTPIPTIQPPLVSDVGAVTII